MALPIRILFLILAGSSLALCTPPEDEKREEEVQARFLSFIFDYAKNILKFLGVGGDNSGGIGGDDKNKIFDDFDDRNYYNGEKEVISKTGVLPSLYSVNEENLKQEYKNVEKSISGDQPEYTK